MKKASFLLKTALLVTLLAYGCGPAKDRALEDPSSNDPDNLPAVDSAAPFADTSFVMESAKSTEVRDPKKAKEPNTLSDKNKKTQSVQQ